MSNVDYELCIIGAGIGGLNALHSASCYLKPSDRVLLVDRRPAVGGMWQDTYDYVRLHQPHPMFTVGDIAWKKTMPAAHLADKQEVNEQFSHCLKQLGQRVELHTLLEHEYETHEESVEGVQIRLKSLGDGNAISVKAKRLIKAQGLDIPQLPPLKFSSERLHSLSPNQVSSPADQLGGGNTPIVIVGGGKTAMDAARHLIGKFPGRDIRMLVGSGVMFANRNRIYTEGWKRWIGGIVPFEYFLEMAMKFTGDNVTETNRYRFEYYDMHSLSVDPKHYMVGFLSEEEFSEIQDGLSSVMQDHVHDVVDTEQGLQMQLRSGVSVDLPVGTWFVNCTGHIATQRVPYEPYVSESGRVLSINMSSLPFFLSSFSGYYLTHLMYREQLLQLPLYALDVPHAAEVDKATLGPLVEVSTVLNTLYLMKVLPLKIFNECRLDFNQWFPMPRRLPIVLRYMIGNDRITRHCLESLERLRQNTGIRMGSLSYVNDVEKRGLLTAESAKLQ